MTTINKIWHSMTAFNKGEIHPDYPHPSTVTWGFSSCECVPPVGWQRPFHLCFLFIAERSVRHNIYMRRRAFTVTQWKDFGVGPDQYLVGDQGCFAAAAVWKRWATDARCLTSIPDASSACDSIHPVATCFSFRDRCLVLGRLWISLLWVFALVLSISCEIVSEILITKLFGSLELVLQL